MADIECNKQRWLMAFGFAEQRPARYREGMTVEAIAHLSEADRRQLADWFEELEERAWDEEIERDFSPGGRGMPLLAELEREIGDGQTRPIEEVCAERRKQKCVNSQRRTFPRFWRRYASLPEEGQRQADKQHHLFRKDQYTLSPIQVCQWQGHAGVRSRVALAYLSVNDVYLAEGR